MDEKKASIRNDVQDYIKLNSEQESCQDNIKDLEDRIKHIEGINANAEKLAEIASGYANSLCASYTDVKPYISVFTHIYELFTSNDNLDESTKASLSVIPDGVQDGKFSKEKCRAVIKSALKLELKNTRLVDYGRFESHDNLYDLVDKVINHDPIVEGFHIAKNLIRNYGGDLGQVVKGYEQGNANLQTVKNQTTFDFQDEALADYVAKQKLATKDLGIQLKTGIKKQCKSDNFQKLVAGFTSKTKSVLDQHDNKQKNKIFPTFRTSKRK